MVTAGTWESPPPTPSPPPHPASAGVTLAQNGVPQRPQGGRSTPCPRASGASASELTRGGTRKREPWVGNMEPWPSELPEVASASHEVTACTHSCGDAQWTQRADPCVFLVLPYMQDSTSIYSHNPTPQIPSSFPFPVPTPFNCRAWFPLPFMYRPICSGPWVTNHPLSPPAQP